MLLTLVEPEDAQRANGVHERKAVLDVGVTCCLVLR